MNTVKRSSWNKKILNRKEYVQLRRLFVQQVGIPNIEKITSFKYPVVYRIARENNWYAARERYYRFLCFLAYKNESSISEYCKKLNLRYEAVKRIKQKYNIKTKRQVHNKRISNDVKKNMIDDYIKGESGLEICKKYGFLTSKTVYDALIQNNIDRRDSPVTYYNEDYFEKINSHDKAYILGFLLMDGYVIKDYDGIGMQLTISDTYILEKIAERLGKSCTVVKINCDHKRKTMPNVKDMSRLHCGSKKIANDLIKFNMVKRKTLILKCPVINKQFLSSFFRGLWDGDGSVGITGQGHLFAVLATASYKFATGIISVCKNINMKIYGKKMFQIRVVGGEKQTIKFYNWIYKNKGDLYLRRKFEKVKDYIDN